MEFKPWPKIPRLANSEWFITEKIDGTNACIIVSDDGTEIAAQSRTRLITPENDNQGFAKWVQTNKEELLTLGPGHHFGEWWGSGIQRRYDLTEKRFSLFNTQRWGYIKPACCHVVPTLASNVFFEDLQKVIEGCYKNLIHYGSYAAPDYMNPEGLIIYDNLSKSYFKVIINK